MLKKYKTEIWAHQGSSNIYIENTIAAFKKAIRDGSDALELDVQRTADGELIVFHDENLKKMAGINEFIWNMDWLDLNKIILSKRNNKFKEIDDSYTNMKIPKLEDVLKLVKGSNITINIELKNSVYCYPNMEKEIIDCVNKFGMQNQVLYSSFNHLSISKISSLIGPKYCGILTEDIQVLPLEYIKKVGATAYHPSINSLNQSEIVEDFHKEGLKVHTWTVNEDVDIWKALFLNVDAIITDKPIRAIELQKKLQNNS